LKVYSEESGERLVDRKIANLAQLNQETVAMHLLESTGWI